MPLGTEVGFNPDDIVLNGQPAAPHQKGTQQTPTFRTMYCGQMAGWIKMPLDMKVGLNPGHIVLDGDPKGHSLPQFFAHVCCGQTAGWIKMPLGMEVDLGGGHTVRWGPTPAPKVAQPLFGPCLLWPNGRPSQLLVSTCLHFGSSVISLEWQLLVFNFVQNHDFSEIKL